MFCESVAGVGQRKKIQAKEHKRVEDAPKEERRKKKKEGERRVRLVKGPLHSPIIRGAYPKSGRCNEIYYRALIIAQCNRGLTHRHARLT